MSVQQKPTKKPTLYKKFATLFGTTTACFNSLNNSPTIASLPTCFIARLLNPRDWPQVSFDYFFPTIPQDVKIIGVTCSSNDAQMHTLTSTVHNGLRYYSCRCRGTMGIGAGNKTFCYIHYWECRLLIERE